MAHLIGFTSLQLPKRCAVKAFTTPEAKQIIAEAIKAGLVKLIGPSSHGGESSADAAKSDAAYLKSLLDELTKA